MASTRIKIPAPTGGWNTTLPIDQMPPDTAIALDNMIPSTGGLMRRGVWTSAYVDGFSASPAAVSPTHGPMIIHEYEDDTAGPMLVIGGSGYLRALKQSAPTSNYDFELVEDAFGATVTGWQWVATNFNNTAIFVNGVDTPFVYEGIGGGGFSAMHFSATATTTASAFTYVHSFKGRLYFAKDADKAFHYLPLNARAGKTNRFNLAEVVDDFGELEIITTWTVDGGDGPDDYIVFISNNGTIAVYQGSDPASITNWALVGVYKTAAPLGKNSHAALGSKVLLATDNDIYTLPDDLSTPNAEATPLSGAIKYAANKYPLNQTWLRTPYIWQMIHGKKDALLLQNVEKYPMGGAITSCEQYGINTLTGGAFRMYGVTINSLGTYQGHIFAGQASADVLLHYLSPNELVTGGGTNDFPNDTASSSNVKASFITAFQDGGAPYKKQVKAVQPQVTYKLASANAPASAEISIYYDFNNLQIGAAERSKLVFENPDWQGSDNPRWETIDSKGAGGAVWAQTPHGAGDVVAISFNTSAPFSEFQYYYTLADVEPSSGGFI